MNTKAVIVKAENRNKPFVPRTMFGPGGPLFVAASRQSAPPRSPLSIAPRPARRITFPMAQMKLVAINRPTGYLDECLRLGILSADESMLSFTPAAFIDIRNRYPETIKTRVQNRSTLDPVQLQTAISNLRGAKGLGDRAHDILGPIGRAIGWPCMKGDGTTDLKPGSPCDKGRTLLNKIKL